MSTTTTPPPTGASPTSPAATCTTAVPGANGHVPIDACNSYYTFDPSFAWNLAFTVLFGLTTVGHVWQSVTFRKRYCWVIVMGALWECLAFALRTAGSRDQQSLGIVIGHSLLLLLAPLWINAFAYMTVARLVHFLLPEQRVWGIRATSLTKIFVGLDIFSFFVQGAGGGLLSNQDSGSADIARAGRYVYMGGIGLQGLFIVVFAILTGRFYMRLREVMRDAGDTRSRNVRGPKVLVWSLYIVLTLILVRIIFRMIEFSGGIETSNNILLSEAYVLGLDGLPMLLALSLINLVHPGMVLKGPESEFPRLSRKERRAQLQQEKEQRQQKKEEKRQRKAEKKAAGKDGFVAETMAHADGHEMESSGHSMA